MTAHVLVVDDLLPNIKLLEAKLTAEYYTVTTARSGKEALEILKNNSFDIILLDVMMPELDGYEVCKIIKADPKHSDTPVIMVTALSEVEDRVNGIKAGADDFLTKPINDLTLFARIKSLLRLKVVTDELKLRSKSFSELGINNDFYSVGLNVLKDAKILLINDDIAESNQIKAQLETQGSTVEILTNPETIIANMIANSYDLAIISTLMIDHDGLRFSAQIRSNEKIRHTPIIILIEEDNNTFLIKGLELGINDYLITPIDNNEVIARANSQVKRKKYQDQLKQRYLENADAAVKDALTGCYNRRYFDVHYSQLFQQSIEQYKELCLIIIDLDHFKHINDAHGHVSGDEALKELPKRIASSIRITDMVVRYGGEEFVIIVPSTNIEQTKLIAERIRKCVEYKEFPISQEPFNIKVTASLGIAMIKPTDTKESLLKRADEGLYKAKEGGRNQICYVE
ncbi:PleD family two-component system response regulator [Rickettsiales endosymbiont of Stachyamoeba lipophora]|uniref:PleD family two-component system response regulator n=1 Tax=Rickettsiales endosymbiont of Stachyamoeba lipophora TaxID=2486578 RepID=UPI000F651894|nr:PleD family two-component system response regulator [Rickettsiales endosymbiont of Stachyamoeba lipophora]AZL15203.1 PleD family two-component system response regulator [Rickettsiales endosymbiont of Stachyamoeba lipophora]